MRYFYDTEFIENGSTIDLVSIGIVAEDGREYYAVSTDADHTKANKWVREHVLDKLPNPSSPLWRSREQIRTEVYEFLTASPGRPELWAWIGAYDHVVLAQLWTDIFPGARVLEAGVGSGALSLALLRAIGPGGKLHSYERRQQFADVARRNVRNFIDGEHPAWELTVGDLVDVIADEPIDRAILDMLAPWECVDAVGERLIPGGVICCYVATTTQLGRVMDTFRAHGGFTEPTATETTVRDWHAEGLAIRPGHGTSAHTGFLVLSRRLAPGVSAPIRKRRPAPGAYGPDYQGPRPLNMPESDR